MKAEHLLFNSRWLSDDFSNEVPSPPGLASHTIASKQYGRLVAGAANIWNSYHSFETKTFLFLSFSNIPGVGALGRGVEIWRYTTNTAVAV